MLYSATLIDEMTIFLQKIDALLCVGRDAVILILKETKMQLVIFS